MSGSGILNHATARHDTMIGTNLLVQIFEVLVLHHCKEKIIRRLYCESGQAGIKSYRFVNDSTKKILDEIIPKCKECKHGKIRHVTMVLIFEELVKLKETELLKETYHQMDEKHVNIAYSLCNKKTQNTISNLGLYK